MSEIIVSPRPLVEGGNTTTPREFCFDGVNVRTMEIDGKTAWVAVDVARALGYKVPDQAVRDTCKDPVKRKVLSSGGDQLSYIIFEPDLYRLVMKCKLPSAQRFEKWVFEEVLPQIRKTGSYVPVQAQATMGIPEALVATGLELRRIADTQEEMNARLARIEQLVPQLGVELKEEFAVKHGRREFSEKVREQNAKVLINALNGRCPISDKLLLNHKGEVDWNVAHLDHWNGHSDNTLGNSWIVHKDENQKMKNPQYRARFLHKFLFWQDKLNPPNLFKQLGFDFGGDQ